MSHRRTQFGLFVALVVFGLILSTIPLHAQNVYVRTNLVSDIAGVANFTDPQSSEFVGHRSGRWHRPVLDRR